MHQSAHTVMFLNNDDFIDAARRQLEQGPMYLSISYLSEILAFEPLYPYSAEWLEFARGRRDFALEIRTKSDYYQAISSLKPSENSFLVWSLSPEDISREHERGCPPFAAASLPHPGPPTTAGH
jgi:spore photoproduct lyase